MKKPRRTLDVENAWIGDAVLTLYARSRILAETGEVDNTRLERMTSNQFLSALGEPTQVEAGIGRVYRTDGLEAAFRHIEQTLMPLYAKQEEKRTVKPHHRKAVKEEPEV